MSSANLVILVGRLGQDPSIKYTPSGAAICSFSIATSRIWKEKDGTKKEETDWHNVVAFNRLGENCAEFLAKGSQCYIEGRLRTETWEKDGEKKYATKVYANIVQFLSGKKEGAVSHDEPVHDDEDVPF